MGGLDKAIEDALIMIQSNGPFDVETGICGNIQAMLRPRYGTKYVLSYALKLSELNRGWIPHSGDNNYPIPGGIEAFRKGKKEYSLWEGKGLLEGESRYVPSELT